LAHWYASDFDVVALTPAKLDARQQSGAAAAAFSMTSRKRRTFHHHLIERIVQHWAEGYRLEKSSPDYKELWNYGIITETAAWSLAEVRKCQSMPWAISFWGLALIIPASCRHRA
jgi:hypothetical protein